MALFSSVKESSAKTDTVVNTRIAASAAAKRMLISAFP